MCGKTGRGKGGIGPKGSGRPADSRGAAERGKAEDAQEFVMGRQVLKSVSSVVRMIIGRVIVQRWMMARRIPKKQNVAGPRMWCVDLQQS